MEHILQEWDTQTKDLRTALSAVRSARAALPSEHEDLSEDLEWVEEALVRELESGADTKDGIVGEDFYTPEGYCA